MPFEGRQVQPKEIAALCHAQGWRDQDLVKIVATSLAESQGFAEAFNDNLDDEGNVLSRDIGIFQISVTAPISEDEQQLLHDPEYNVKRAWSLYSRRKFNPWVAYKSGWATFPEWWVWTKAEPHHWAPTGRYIHRALRGVAHFYAEEFGVEVPMLDYVIPPRPTDPPADGVGNRPTPNDGST